MDVQRIGWVISQRSAVILVIQIVAFPPLQARVGTLRLYNWLMALWIPAFACLPLANSFAKSESTIMVWISLYGFMLLSAGAGMSFGESLDLCRRVLIVLEADSFQSATCSSPMLPLQLLSYWVQSMVRTISHKSSCVLSVSLDPWRKSLRFEFGALDGRMVSRLMLLKTSYE